MLNERIKKLRTLCGMSQVEMAAKLGISKQSVSNWENDNIQPSIEMLLKIARLFSVSTDYLLGIENPSRKTIDVTGLDEEDIKLLLHTAEVLRSKNKKTEAP